MIGDLFDSPWKILIVAVVLIVLFGSAKLPGAARSLGKSMRILKAEVKDLHEDGTEPTTTATQQAVAPAVQRSSSWRSEENRSPGPTPPSAPSSRARAGENTGTPTWRSYPRRCWGRAWPAPRARGIAAGRPGWPDAAHQSPA